MKKACKLLLATVAIAAFACICSIGAYAVDENESLSASAITFGNGDISRIETENNYVIGDANGDGSANSRDILMIRRHASGIQDMSMKEQAGADVDGNGKLNSIDVLFIKRFALFGTYSNIVEAESSAALWSRDDSAARIKVLADNFSVRVDLSGFESSGKYIYIAAEISLPDSNEINVSATPLYSGRKWGYAGYAFEPVLREGDRFIFRLTGVSGCEIDGVILSFNGNGCTGESVYISELFVCENEYSAEWVFENRICPADAVPAKKLSVSLEPEYTAMRLLDMTQDDRTNTNGGIYHDFKNCKWPSVAVDENDNLYIVSSGIRMSHVCPFGATLFASSTDGGRSWTKPSVISNTILDDRDAGITYLGGGKMLVTYFTGSASYYLPGGGGYDSLKPYSMGGGAPDWAGVWDYLGNPVGGIIGTHLDILDYVVSKDPSYDTSEGSYVIQGTDYGKNWDVTPYSFPKSGYTDEMKTTLDNFRYNRPGIRVPVTNCHGPLLLSDGTLLYAGKVMDDTDQPIDSMAVYTSDDDGATWEYLSEIPRPYGYDLNNFHELSVAETNDGALVCAIRTQSTDRVILDPWFTVYTCFSYDGGQTWTVPAPTGMDGAPPHIVKAANGDLIMTYSYRTDPRCIYASVSTDGGRTWSNRAVVSGPFLSYDDMGYPASAVLSDGTICTVYYGTYHRGSSGEGYSSILCTRWTYELN